MAHERSLASTIFSDNPYVTLGLFANSTNQEAQRRSKEIVGRLKIGDTPEYPPDLSFLGIERDEMTVKAAITSLSQPASRILEKIFWFSFDESERNLFENNNFEELFRKWNLVSDEGLSRFNNLKNSALLSLVLLYSNKDRDAAVASIVKWEQLLKEKSLWQKFEQDYFINDEVSCAPQILKDLNALIIERLRKVYSEISNKLQAPIIFKEFNKTILKDANTTDSTEITSPIFKEIDDVISKIKALKFNVDGILDEDSRIKLDEYIVLLLKKIDQFEELGLDMQSDVKTIRDRVSTALRGVVLILNNELAEQEIAKTILESAVSIAGTESEKTRLSDDLATIEGIIKRNAVIDELDRLSSEKQHFKVIEVCDRRATEFLEEVKFQAELLKRKKTAVLLIGLDYYNSGTEHLKAGHNSDAAEVFQNGFGFLRTHIVIFDEIKPEYFQNLMEKGIPEFVEGVRGMNFGVASSQCNKLMEAYKETFGENSDEFYFLAGAVKCRMYGCMAAKGGKLLKSAPAMRTINGVGTKIYGDTLYFVVLFIPILPLSRYVLESNGNSYSFYEKLSLHNWQKYWIYLVVAGVAIFIGSDIWSSKKSSRYSDYQSSRQAVATPSSSNRVDNYNNTNSDVTMDGYRCSSYYAKLLREKLPTGGTEDLERELARLKAKSAEITELGKKIENLRGTISTEDERSDFNALVQSYNSELQTYQSDNKALDVRLAPYREYLDSLKSYCTKVGS